MTERLVPYELGQTAASGELTHLLGYRAYFNDFDQDVSGAKPALTAHTIEALWVKNSDTTANLPGTIMAWEAAAVGTATDDLCGAAARGAGVVDPYLPAAGVAAGEHYWLIVKGPCDVIHAGNDTISAGSELVTAASGRVDLYDGTATADSEGNSRFGRAMENPADVAATKFRALVDFRF